MKSLIIIGAGGAGLDTLLVAQRMGQATFQVLGFADDNPQLVGQTVEGMPVLGGINEVADKFQGSGVLFHCAIGSNRARKKVALFMESRGFSPATLIDPTAVIAPSAEVGAGAYAGPHVYIGPQARVGRHALLNVGAMAGHNGVVGDYAQVCPGARLCGHAMIGEGAFIGSNGVLIPLVRVGAWSSLAACSAAVKELPDNVTAAGVPARIIATTA